MMLRRGGGRPPHALGLACPTPHRVVVLVLLCQTVSAEVGPEEEAQLEEELEAIEEEISQVGKGGGSHAGLTRTTGALATCMGLTGGGCWGGVAGDVP